MSSRLPGRGKPWGKGGKGKGRGGGGGRDAATADQEVTVAEPVGDSLLPDPEMLPLQYKWTLWHNGPQSSSNSGWTDRQVKIADFGTIASFWRTFNNLAPPSNLEPGSDYHMFKGSIKPAWEDPFNENGGTWTYRINGRDDSAPLCNFAWYNTVLHLIGDQFVHGEAICGVVMSIRKNHRHKIGLWIKNVDQKERVRAIGLQFKKLTCPEGRQSFVQFLPHESAKRNDKRDLMRL